ncbi:hypothetical protein IC617_08335 [Neiella sp. HB171785]|uniref:PRTRC system protein E n=1 Tax=Neiella litorisoli TaxID=2771431 RepID=A0A8J6UPT5_9GAMM|nr:hypothetical protein [Neiella litorisoli]MBD1389432.1 hypothetical protein [Neiella litorisoli]
MIEQICTLLNDAQASSMHIVIRPDGQGNVSLSFLVQGCELATDDEAKKNAKAFNLRAALAKPLLLNGAIGEMDVEAISALIQYADSYVPAQQAFHAASTNLNEVFSTHRAATPKDSKKPESHDTDGGTGASADNAAPAQPASEQDFDDESL